MPAMKTEEIRGKSHEVLASELAATKRELFDLRFKSASQSLPDPSRIRVLRRTIARMGTVVRERELKEAGAKAAKTPKVANEKAPNAAKAPKAPKASKAKKA
jgi:large subunit ribosomal protein L29